VSRKIRRPWKIALTLEPYTIIPEAEKKICRGAEKVSMCTIFDYGEEEAYDELIGKDVVPRLSEVNEFDRFLISNEKDCGLVTLQPLVDVDTLWAAAEAGDFFGIRRCIDAGVDVDAQDDTDRYCALLCAAEGGHFRCVALLAEADANIDARDAFGRTPCYAAAVSGHVAVVKYLCDKGADVDAADDDGRTPLWAACATRQLDAAGLLVTVGADVHRPDHNGQSPFDFASQAGHADVIKFLHDNGGHRSSGRLDL